MIEYVARGSIILFFAWIVYLTVTQEIELKKNRMK
jgi:hypothetical protein